MGRLTASELKKIREMSKYCTICHRRFFFNLEDNFSVCYHCGGDSNARKKENL